MLRHSAAVGSRSLLRASTSFASRPLACTSLLRPSTRTLATSTKAHEHYSKAFKTIDKTASASSSPPTTNPYPTPTSQPTTTPTPTTPSLAAASVPASATVGTPVTYARRLSPSTPSPFQAGPPDEPVNPFDDPNSILSRWWERFAYFFRTTLQGLLIFGWVLVATRIVLTFYPPEEWGKAGTTAVTDAAAATTTTSSSAVALVPVTTESSDQASTQ